jgi:hypothetical protein
MPVICDSMIFIDGAQSYSVLVCDGSTLQFPDSLVTNSQVTGNENNSYQESGVVKHLVGFVLLLEFDVRTLYIFRLVAYLEGLLKLMFLTLQRVAYRILPNLALVVSVSD